ncbi:MAG TPA: glycoside hydrolase family 3 N-terminal domain-containing protein [Verrucomicrobiae bacterium]|nr:glycoside hydrolase family 3 N-terminal domain-containing protein [Verrucomicrobiae bacterium]
MTMLFRLLQLRTSRAPRRLNANGAAVVAATLLLNAASPANAGPGTEERVESLLSQMTLAEKIGQMTQVDSNALKDKADIQKYALGSVLSGGGSDPTNNSAAAWRQLAEECQSWARKTRLQIPLLYGVDAVHGHNNVDGAVIFPHNIGLGATRNAALVEEAGAITAREVAGTGINWTFAPCVAVALDSRWGRTYESFSDSPALAGELGAAAVRGIQANSVLACAKHYVGDGGTRGGVDQGDVVLDEATLRKIHLSPYLPSIQGNVGSIMASFNSWKGKKLHGHKHLLTDVLKGELGFKGFIVSDWAAIDQLPTDYKGDIEASINAGLDMVMIPNPPDQPNNYVEFITKLTQLVNEGRVPMARIDDAVRRILRAKIETGVFEPQSVDALTAAIGSEAHRKVARECVRQSLVLLKNERSALPLSRNAKRVVVVGKAADDLGMQCGGWTISWQGATGKVTSGGTTILEAIRRSVGNHSTVTHSTDGAGIQSADMVVVVIGEIPYAEGKGDRKDLSLPAADVALVKKAKQSGAPVVTILLSGRPLVLGEALDSSDAFIAAWLPGTEGMGVADVLFGDFKPTGKLPRAWPRAGKSSKAESAFAFGYGLSFKGNGLAETRPGEAAATR